MKLRNFMYATMIACAFASCSKDDVVGPEGPDTAKGDANFAVVVNTKLATKAIEDGSGTQTGTDTKKGEDAIKSLALVVFDGSGNYLKAATVNAKEGESVYEISVTDLAPGNIQFRVFANMPDITVATFSTLKASDLNASLAVIMPTDGYTRDFSTGLPMSSAASLTTTLATGDNYYGYAQSEVPSGITPLATTAVPLYRNVSRVELNSIALNMAFGDYSAGKATFSFTDVNVLDATSKANLDATTATGATYLSGPTSTFLSATNAGSAVATYTIGTTNGAQTISDASKAYFYVLGNTANATNAVNSTKLVVKGHFKLEGGVDRATGATVSTIDRDGFYPVTIGYTNDNIETGTTGVLADAGLVNNKVYKIDLVVAGPGKITIDGGDPANFFVKCAVADWVSVSQGAVIK